MGFFQSLKDDLSVAVNEMIGDEEKTANEKENEEVNPLIPEEEEDLLLESEAKEDIPEKSSTEAVDIDKMLDELTEELSNEEPKDEPKEKKQEELKEEPEESKKEENKEIKEEIKEKTIELEDKVETDEIKSGKEEKAMEDMTQKPISDDNALITSGMTITGNIETDGNMEVFGVINGNLNIAGKLNISGTICGDSKANEVYAEGAEINGEVEAIGSVKVGQSTVIIGNVTASSAVIAGAVKGDIDVKGPVVLDSSAIVMGNIKSQSVQISNGAVIEGMCSQCYATVNPTSFFEEFKKTAKASKTETSDKKEKKV